MSCISCVVVMRGEPSLVAPEKRKLAARAFFFLILLALQLDFPLYSQEISESELSYAERAQRAVLKEPYHWTIFGQYFPVCHVIAESGRFSPDSALPSFFGLSGGCCAHTLHDDFLFEKFKLLADGSGDGTTRTGSSKFSPLAGSQQVNAGENIFQPGLLHSLIWSGIQSARKKRHDNAYKAWQRILAFVSPRWDKDKGRIVYNNVDRVETLALLKVFVEELLRRGVLSEDREGTHLAHASSLRAALSQKLTESSEPLGEELKSLACMALGYGAMHVFEPYGSLFTVHASAEVDDKSQMLRMGAGVPSGEVLRGPGIRFPPGEYTYEFSVFSRADVAVNLVSHVLMTGAEGTVSRFSRTHLLPSNRWQRIKAPLRVLRRDSNKRVDVVLSWKGPGSLTVGPLRIHRYG